MTLHLKGAILAWLSIVFLLTLTSLYWPGLLIGTLAIWIPYLVVEYVLEK